MVDELRSWPQRANTAQGRRWFGEGKSSAHLSVDGPIEDLHAFAARIGLKREWFQEHATMPHYDLTPKRHAMALAAGAVLVPGREQARRRIELRAAARASR